MMNALQLIFGVFFMGCGCFMLPMGWQMIQDVKDRTEVRTYYVSYSFNGGTGVGHWDLADIGHNLKPLAERIQQDANVKNVAIDNWIQISR